VESLPSGLVLARLEGLSHVIIDAEVIKSNGSDPAIRV
jgi:hypothetical protein